MSKIKKFYKRYDQQSDFGRLGWLALTVLILGFLPPIYAWTGMGILLGTRYYYLYG